MGKPRDNLPLVLMILDGWGHREAAADNAISCAHTPCWDRLWREQPHCLLDTSGEAVGLPAEQMGNSEVGHMNIGAGRIVYQELTRISRAISDGEFDTNPVLCSAFDGARESGGAVHVMGLLSPGGVHSHEEHFIAAVRLAAARGAERIWVHAFLDGRDTPPRSARASIDRMQSALDRLPAAHFATVTGRYYAMDRDQRWARTEQAWNAIVGGRAEFQAESAGSALEAAYRREQNDEFVQPTVIGEFDGVHDGDAVLFVNFRADRARQLTRAFLEPAFPGFARQPPRLAAFVCMTEYMAELGAAVAYPAAKLHGLLGESLAAAGLRQLRIAETEKYAHVTFFFNGGEEQPFAGEQRQLIPSPQVATYDLQPQMSAPELAEALDRAIRSGAHDVIVCNVANPDMVGHTGILPAAIRAVEAVDDCLARVCQALDAVGGELLITSDHGNVEEMSDPGTGQAHTAHTTNPVPLVYRGRAAEMASSGTLRDVAPTMLYLLGLPRPAEMSGKPLLRLIGTQRGVA